MPWIYGNTPDHLKFMVDPDWERNKEIQQQEQARWAKVFAGAKQRRVAFQPPVVLGPAHRDRTEEGSSSSAESPSRKRSRIDDSVTTSDLPLAKRLNLNTDTDGFADVPGLNEQVSLTRKRARDESDDSVTASDDSVTTSDASVAAPDCPPSKRQHTFDVDKDDIFALCDQVVRDPSILDTLSDEQGQTYIRRVSLALGKFQEIPGGA